MTWLDAHPYAIVGLTAIVFAVIYAASSYARGRHEDHELAAWRRMRAERRNRQRDHGFWWDR